MNFQLKTEDSSREQKFFRFESKEEMDRFKLARNLKMTDLERFRMFLSLMRLGKTLKNAPKIHKQII
jgi:hypothetical protein